MYVYIYIGYTDFNPIRTWADEPNSLSPCQRARGTGPDDKGQAQLISMASNFNFRDYRETAYTIRSHMCKAYRDGKAFRIVNDMQMGEVTQSNIILYMMHYLYDFTQMA